MSSRALRKLQGRMDLGAVPRSEDTENKEEEEEEEEADNFVKPASSYFDLLNKSEENVSEFQEEEEEKNEDEGEKPEIPIPASSTKSAKKNKKKKSKKNKESMATIPDSSSSQKPKNKPPDLSAMTLEELDKAIREIDEKLGPQTSAPATYATSPTSISENLSTRCRSLLSVDTRFLDAEAEMKRMFGARVVGSEGRTAAVSGRGRGHKFKKSHLAAPKADWPRIEKHGLEMSAVEKENGIEFTFTHSLAYQHVQEQFWRCVRTHDPNTLVALLQVYPYHVDCLLQLSEVAKQSGDWQNAGDFVERALYSFERAFHPMFNISSGSVRLNYQIMENRSFFLALHRQIQFLARRGCWRTAFEFDKLLLGMDPKGDPLCALLSIDFHALKSHQFSYFLSLQAEWPSAAYLPNFAFSAAYAKFKVEEQSKDNVHEQSGFLLQRAICWFPSIVPALLDKCSEKDIVIGQNSVLLGNSASNTPYLNLLSDLFVEQNSSLWKEPEVMDWLKTNARIAINRLQSPSDPDTIEGRRICSEEYSRSVPLNVSRYILLSEHSSLLHHLPADVRSTSYMLYDPLPPADSINSYHDSETNSDAVNGLLASLQRRLAPFWGEGRGGGAAREHLDVFIRELEAAEVVHNRDNEEGNEGNIARDFLRRLRDSIARLVQPEGTGQAEDAEANEDELVNEDT